MKFTNTQDATAIRAQDAKIGVLYKQQGGLLLMRMRPCAWQNSKNDAERVHFVIIKECCTDYDVMNTCILDSDYMLTPMGRPTFTFPE